MSNVARQSKSGAPHIARERAVLVDDHISKAVAHKIQGTGVGRFRILRPENNNGHEQSTKCHVYYKICPVTSRHVKNMIFAYDLCDDKVTRLKSSIDYQPL